MKALYFNQHGEADVLQFGDLADPEISAGETLIKVNAVALNHLDIWVRRGWPGLNLKLPHIGGSDIAGEVIETNCDKTLIGKKVIINPGITTSDDRWVKSGQDSLSPGYKIIGEQLPGGTAEYVKVPTKNLLVYPENLSAQDAAAPVLVGITTWRMLFDRAKLKPGMTLLIVGSGGGVNLMSLLIAKAKGIKTIVLCGGEEKLQKTKNLGADHTIDYKVSPDWHKEVLKITHGIGADVVVDNVGEASFAKSIKAVAKGGAIVTVGNTTGWNISYDNRVIFSKQISIIGSTMGSTSDFNEAMTFIWKKKIKIPIDTVSLIKDGKEMHLRMEKGEQFGKIVLLNE
ncbi:MAG: zinc-binding dehydrogenase [Bdellovibrionales bacterium]|nr:zinc-binding dehydrogenase [Bdellovibrionales bacterium]